MFLRDTIKTQHEVRRTAAILAQKPKREVPSREVIRQNLLKHPSCADLSQVDSSHA